MSNVNLDMTQEDLAIREAKMDVPTDDFYTISESLDSLLSQNANGSSVILACQRMAYFVGTGMDMDFYTIY